MADNQAGISQGIKAGFPIFIGYFPMAMAFGLLGKAGGIAFIPTVSFSVLVFAGASQFMALNLLTGGAAAAEIILATFLLNFRHLLMSASLAAHLKERKSRWLPLVAFGVTDETFAVASTLTDKPNAKFLLGLEGIAYSGWVAGTIAGYAVGASLPVSVQASLGITLYAMFAAILVPQFQKSGSIVILALGSGVLHWLIRALKVFSGGWSLIVAMVLTAVLGAIFMKNGDEQTQ
ncbi:MAG TPA: autotransporter [Firmicutes bacterium]|jgi:4-azaleucine resistance transporter AzlC|nr:autotransporter [Bacillota bacterium]